MHYTELNINDIIVPVSTIRTSLNKEKLEGLAASLKETGMLQPILVRDVQEKYELVAGLRRLKAAELAGFSTIRAIVLSQKAGDPDALQIQLVENLQREDLNPIERAKAVHNFIQYHKITKVAASERLGIPRTTLNDWLNLLDVSPRFQDAVIDNFEGGDSPVTTSHVNAALALGRRLQSPNIAEILLNAVIQHKLSKSETRQVAKIVREQRDTSIDDAIRTIRRQYVLEDEQATVSDSVDYLPHEENLRQLVHHLARSTREIERMNHVSGRFISKESIDRKSTRLNSSHVA